MEEPYLELFRSFGGIKVNSRSPLFPILMLRTVVPAKEGKKMARFSVGEVVDRIKNQVLGDSSFLGRAKVVKCEGEWLTLSDKSSFAQNGIRKGDPYWTGGNFGLAERIESAPAGATVPRRQIVYTGIRFSRYRISDKDAKWLAKNAKKELPESHMELRVELPGGHMAWLQQGLNPAVKRRWSWEVAVDDQRRFYNQKGR